MENNIDKMAVESPGIERDKAGIKENTEEMRSADVRTINNNPRRTELDHSAVEAQSHV